MCPVIYIKIHQDTTRYRYVPLWIQLRYMYLIMYLSCIPHVRCILRATPLYGGGRDVQHRHTAKKTKPPNPPPVGKAGFEVWVLSKGGLYS